MMQQIHIQQWDKEKFFNIRDEWNDLLSRSSADQLFLSWEWQSSWWQIFSDPEDMCLRLFVALDENKNLIGIAPLYIGSLTTKKIFNTNRLQFIGNHWRGRATMPTELLTFIADKSQEIKVIRALYTYINSLGDWDEFIIPYLNLQSETYQLLMNENLLPKCYLRHTEQYYSYHLTLKGQFIDYINQLGKNTRLKLYNRRSALEKLGSTSFKRMLPENIEKLFEVLNTLHKKRWGSVAFQNERLEFNKAVALLMADKNCLNISLITLEDNPVSIQYNYIVNKKNYNIQSGFDESLHKNISLGYLHFGYEIEASFDQHHTTYNFLAGEGKNTQYKERLTKEHLQMVDLQIIRRPALKMLYRLYDLFG